MISSAVVSCYLIFACLLLILSSRSIIAYNVGEKSHASLLMISLEHLWSLELCFANNLYNYNKYKMSKGSLWFSNPRVSLIKMEKLSFSLSNFLMCVFFFFIWNYFTKKVLHHYRLEYFLFHEYCSLHLKLSVFLCH